MIKVTAVEHGSIAEELGLQVGTELIAIDGRELEDFLDWEFATAEESFLLHVRQPDGEEIEFDIERPLGEPIGVALEPVRIRRCANRCDFCFVDGLPDGLRDVLYIRDDDYRLSFRYGNFATLTNLKPRDIQPHQGIPAVSRSTSRFTRPIRPIRRYLLRNPSAPEIIPQLREFADAGIEFHTQVVMSPGVNDGEVLRQTLAELFAFGPAILGCSVVPGRTHRVQQAPPGARADRRGVSRRHHPDRRAGRDRSRRAGAHLGLRSRRALSSRRCRAAARRDLRRIRPGRERRRRGALAATADRRGRRRILPSWAGRRVGVVTGTAMAPLMPMVLEPLAAVTGAHFELIPGRELVVRPLASQPRACCPARRCARPSRPTTHLDLALLPGESLNDDASSSIA